MDDLKSKVLDLIKLKGHSRIRGGFHDLTSTLEGPAEGDCTVDSGSLNATQPDTQPEIPQPSDEEILDTVEKLYFSTDQEFDPSRYELERVGESFDLEEMEKSLRRLKQQHTVVSNKVLQMILEKQAASLQEFNRVIELESVVKETEECVKAGRRRLAEGAACITTAGLAVLANSRRRALVDRSLRSLRSIARLRRMEREGEERMRTGDVEGAVKLMIETRRVAGQYSGQFPCVAALSSKLQDSLVMAEEQLDQLLAAMCYEFDDAIFSQVDSAYRVLGKTQAATDQLLMHYTSTLHSAADSAVRRYVDPTHLATKPEYERLCKMVEEEKLVDCLASLCKALWAILLSYYKLYNYTVTAYSSSSGGGKVEGTQMMEEYRRQKVETGRSRLWHDAQSKVSKLVLSAKLANYKFDDFLRVLALLHRLSEVGDELCGEGTSVDELSSSIKLQSQAYFLRYHSTRLDDLRAFLDNESWAPCPISHHFNFLHLQEWRGLRSSVEKCGGVNKSNRRRRCVENEKVGGEAQNDDTSSSVGAGEGGLFNTFPSPARTPFDQPPPTQTLESNDNACGYSSDESLDEEAHSESEETMLVSNTTLTVLRLCGKYLQMVKYLDSVVVQVVASLCQLFEYYLYTVYNIFTSQNSQWHMSPSIKLQAVLKRIRESLIDNDENQAKVLEAEGMLVDCDSDVEASLEARTVAVESLVFLSDQYHMLRPYLEQLLSSNNSSLHKLNQFYTQTVGVSGEVRGPVYSSLICSLVDIKGTLESMSRVDWELKNIVDMHSPYVDKLLADVDVLQKRLSQMKVGGLSPLPKAVVHSLWDSLLFKIADLFVEGFSSSRKCSNGGRGLMQLDWEQFKSKLSRLCPLRPMPHSVSVEQYIKAYYLPEQELTAWIKLHHSEYSSKQLVALVCSATQSDRKARLRLTSFLEELVSDQSASPVPR